MITHSYVIRIKSVRDGLSSRYLNLILILFLCRSHAVGGRPLIEHVAIRMPFGSCSTEAFRYATILSPCYPGTYSSLLLDCICPEQDNLSVLQRFRRYSPLTNVLTGGYTNSLMPWSNAPCVTDLSSMPWFNAPCVTDSSTPQSNAPCITLYTNHLNYYSSTIEERSVCAFSSCVSYPPCLEWQCTSDNFCVCMFSASVGKLLLRMKDIVLSFLGQLSSPADSLFIRLFLQAGRHSFYIGYDCLYLSRNSSYICVALNLKFQQTLHTKHDFRELKKRLIGRFDYLQGIQLQTLVGLFHNCICWRKCRRRFTSTFRYKFNQHIQVHNGIHIQSLSDVRPGSSNRPSCRNKHQECQRTYNLGGAASRLFHFSLIRDYLASDRSLVSQLEESMFRYIDHVQVDDVGMCYDPELP